ncbi:PREDICTED: protein SODIUM POTASSIUM ROOT DEFECTIVE 1 [Camelina sativa]|uniref:Protein SODIUM POTASSIUM ROOT DEFECTIVE 1 n=1 Tax=Camelina sativa TaxID=90675 RepID=A0ABM0V7F9_CAMSA|nr:PREDICTED: protein SODIUM POTASSIUM ROOT DEFECTIVE 1 [Camelina sativa]XP_010452108.1 PREDICTED: protein SODIUM POTASSIUM ROOT DEFECTIVE 1 [Camelina sativa]XP_010452109.1 PREDICTED: protein SODIUM POTASSIUM ROOT DEFECTIVE 1 [Camelina sativa]
MLCASQASATTICSSMDKTSQPSSSSSSSSATIRLGGRAIDRHNPIIRDGRRLTLPPSPNLNPSSSSSSTYHTPLKTRLGLESSEQKRVAKRKSKKGDADVGKSPVSCFSSDTPQGSSRYLLSNPVLFDGFVDSDPIQLPIDEPEITKADDLDNFHEDRLIINASKYVSSSSSSTFLGKKQPDFFGGFLDYEPVLSPDNPFSEPTKASPTASLSSLEDKNDVSSPDFKFSLPPPPPPSPPPPSPPPTSQEKNSSSDQVVVLRVSLHCKGCAGKVKKHLSKLKGVTSYNIDFAAKKVTVTGDVTPLTVLASISKVKNAQFWPEIITQK